MKYFSSVVKSDYIQRTRSYSFLITLCASLAIAYTFVPEPNANYSTIRIGDYVGYYNSAWFGYVTAIMTSLFLSLIGFYLVNSAIKTDRKAKIGILIATTSTSNFRYLLSKLVSNCLVLITIMGAVFCMSILLFFLYNDGYSFEIIQFLKPYLLITVPALLFVSALAVVFEVLFAKYSILQNILFFFAFSFLIAFTPKNDLGHSLDVFGSKIVMSQLEETVRGITKSDTTKSVNIGYVLGNVKQSKKFQFDGINFSPSFILSRLLWIGLGFGLVGVVAPLFHRFDIKKPKKKPILQFDKKKIFQPNAISVSKLAVVNTNYGLIPLVKTEFKMLLRKGKKWVWLVNIVGMIALGTLPMELAHQLVLPILWFLQVHRVSDISTKEKTHNIDLLVLSSYKPIRRLFLSQLISSILLFLLLASPLIIKNLYKQEYTTIVSIVLGGLLIVFLASVFGQLSKGKKLFEVVFFMITYANINAIPLTDYYGGMPHDNGYSIKLLVAVILLTTASFTITATRSD